MSDDTSLKVLIALNAVQMFITVLLVALMVSTGLASRSSSLGGASLAPTTQVYGLPAQSASTDPMAGGAPFGAAPPAAESFGGQAPGQEAAPPPPGEGASAAATTGGPGTPAPPPQEGPITTTSSKKASTLKGYLSLVSRRLDLAARASGLDPKQWLPSDADLAAAIASEDVASEPFQKVIGELKKGYEALGLDFPDLPALPSDPGGP